MNSEAISSERRQLLEANLAEDGVLGPGEVEARLDRALRALTLSTPTPSNGSEPIANSKHEPTNRSQA